MILSSNTSEQEKFKERFFKFCNNCIDFLVNNPIFTIVLIVTLVIVVVMLVISGIFKIEIINTKLIKNHLNARRKNKYLTHLPAGKPHNPSAPFPPKLRKLIRSLKKGHRNRVVICCRSQGEAIELGKLLYQKIHESKIAHYLGWLDYKTQENGILSIKECILADFAFLPEATEDCNRYYDILNILKNKKIHTILFLNLVEHPKGNDYDLDKLNNLDGLSTILISTEEVPGYQAYSFTETEVAT